MPTRSSTRPTSTTSRQATRVARLAGTCAPESALRKPTRENSLQPLFSRVERTLRSAPHVPPSNALEVRRGNLNSSSPTFALRYELDPFTLAAGYLSDSSSAFLCTC